MLNRIINPCDYAFVQWMSNDPLGHHPLTEKRFYCFVKTVIRHNNQKYRDYSYFEKRIKEFAPFIEDEVIYQKYQLMLKLIDFHCVPPVPFLPESRDNKSYLVKAEGTEIVYEEVSQDVVINYTRKYRRKK